MASVPSCRSTSASKDRKRSNENPADFSAGFFFGRYRAQRRSLLGFDQLDLVTVRILDEGNDRTAMLHGPGCARNLHALFGQLIAGGIDIRHIDRQMAKGRTELIRLLLTPVMGQLDHRV